MPRTVNGTGQGQPQHRRQRRFGGVGAAETTSYVAEMSLGRLFQGTVALDQCLRTKRRIRNVPEIHKIAVR